MESLWWKTVQNNANKKAECKIVEFRLIGGASNFK